MNYKKDDAYSNLERVNNWISNCDSKASILIAVMGLIIGFTTEVFNSVRFLKNIILGESLCSAENITLVVFQLILLIAYLTSLVIAVFHIIKALNPKLDNKEFCGDKLERNSILFFETIAQYNYESFSKRIANISEEEFLNDINSQVYYNSCICSKKFIHVKKAIKWVIISGAIVVVLLILVKLI